MILNLSNLTAEQIVYSLLAVPAFLPATVCTGYMAAWWTNLHRFRQRSLVERLFWSVPLSLAISPIATVLIGKFLSLAAMVAFLAAISVLWLVTLGREWFRLRRSGIKWSIGWQPLGGKGLILVFIWIAVVILSLVDIQSNQKLFMSVATFDHSARVAWTESVLRTGIPPANPLYWYKHSATMRNYYFWYVVCAAVAKMANLPARAVLIASCVWAGFALAALIGLYLKHFLAPGDRLRRQFLISISLLAVTGLDICVHVWNLFYFTRLPGGDLEGWSTDGVTSWLDSLLFVPHHIASLVCCMFALLLAWMAGKDGEHRQTASVVLISAALASAFGLSIYVAFAFFIVALAWGLWQITIERTPRPPLRLGAGGAGAVIFLLPYLWELTHGQSEMHGGSLFAIAIREMFSPNGLLLTRPFQLLSIGHPVVARNFANLLLLAPGYAVELGFFLAVFVAYMIPAWRGGKPLTVAHRSLVFIVAVTLFVISIMRSLGELTTNDFGWRAALLLQFPLLLLASELLTTWGFSSGKLDARIDCTGSAHRIPYWIRSIVSIALVIGVISTFCQILMLRMYLPVVFASWSAAHNPEAGKQPHNAYISSIGYAQMDATIPRDAIVQYNPIVKKDVYWPMIDSLGADHQTVISFDQPSCGSELGGDPSGCPAMASAIDLLFNGATAEQARATCLQYGIGYLVTRVYDPVWNDRHSWVWTLRPVVSNEEFRALDCH